MKKYDQEIEDRAAAAIKALSDSRGLSVKDAPAPKVLDITDHLEALIKSQSTEEKSILEVLTELGAPIVSVAVMDARDIRAKVLGAPRPREANAILGSTKPYDNETLFQAATVVVVDSKHLPGITLKQLLSHTSGLGAHGFGGYSKTQLPTLQQIISGEPPANNEPVKLQTFPGHKFSYSGGGFIIIQSILETHFQKPFHQIMDEMVLTPLEMKRSTFQILPAIEENYAPVFLTGHNKSDPDHFLLPESAAAGLWTTPSDLLLAVQTVQLPLETDSFLGKEWAEKMLTEVREGMALGWRSKKATHFEHAGSNDPGYRSFFVGYRGVVDQGNNKQDEDEELDDWQEPIPRDCGFCVMASSALADLVQDKIMHAIPYLNNWPSVLESPVVPFVDRNKVVDERAKAWCGRWGPGDWNLVHNSDEEFYIGYDSSPLIELIPGAIVPKKCDKGSSIDLVAEGLELMLRLTWKDGLEVIEVCQEGESTTLERETLE